SFVIAYTGSPTFRKVVDDYIASGKFINVNYAPGIFKSIGGAGTLNIDLTYLDNRYFINDLGKAVAFDLTSAIVHEIGHAILNKSDPGKNGPEDNANDFLGDNVRWERIVENELGLDPRNSYWGTGTAALRAGYDYTNGNVIDASAVVKTSANINSSG